MYIEDAIRFMHLHKEKKAVEDDNGSMTYGQLDLESSCVYSYLKHQGIGKENFVLITLSRGIRCVAAILGVIKSGASFVILDSSYPADRVNYIRRDVNALCEINDDNYPSIVSTNAPLEGYEKTDVHDAAFAVYTSGSTGNPKGVLHEYGNIELIATLNSRFDEIDGDYNALVAPFYFVAGIMGVINLFTYVRPMYIISSSMLRDLNKLKEFIIKKKISSIYLSPSYLRLYKEPAPCLRKITTGSEPASGIYYGDDGPVITNCYSMSEAGFPILMMRLDRSHDIAPVGRPVLDVDVHLEDENGNRIEGSGKGEICFRNEYVRGYINLPDVTAKAFVDKIFHTGDIGRRDENGLYYIIGRKDDMFKINGNRVEPSEIERHVEAVTGLNKVVAKGFCINGRSFICLYFIRNEAERLGLLTDGKLDIDENSLKKLLPSYMIPTYYIPLERFPINANGKMVRRLLEPPVTGDVSDGYVEPEPGNESLIADIMAKVLNISRVGAEDDFYQIGGDSVRSIAFCAMASDEGLQIPLSALHKFRTPRAIVKNIDLFSDLTEEELIKADEDARKKAMPLLQMQYINASSCEKDANAPIGKIKLMYKLKDDINLDRLSLAIDKVFRHHPILLTVFEKDGNGRFVQRYDPSVFVPTGIIDMSEEDFRENMGSLEGKFGIEERRLHYRGIIRTEEGNYLLLVFHHILIDGMGIRIICDNIFRAYEDEELKRDCYYYLLEKMSESVEGDIKEEAIRELRTSGIDDLSGILQPDLEGPDTCPGIKKDLIISKENEGNVFYLACCLLALIRCNGTDKGVVYWGYNGRDDELKQNSAGGFVSYLPVCVDVGSARDPESIISEVKRQVDYYMVHNIFMDGGYAKDTKPVNTMMFLYQKDIYDIGLIEGLISEVVKMPVDVTSPMGILSVRLTKTEGSDKLPTLFVYSKGYYSEKLAEKYFSEFKKSILYLRGEINAVD